MSLFALKNYSSIYGQYNMFKNSTITLPYIKINKHHEEEDEGEEEVGGGRESRRGECDEEGKLGGKNK